MSLENNEKYNFELRVLAGVDCYFYHKHKAYELMNKINVNSKDFIWDYLEKQYKKDRGLVSLSNSEWGIDGFYEAMYFSVIGYEVKNNIEEQIKEMK